VQHIFIGDVQGCADEFEAMIARARERYGEDFELWSVGDLVNRGPASLRVLVAMRELVERGRARFVLGNHELALLRTAWGLRERSAADSFGDVLDARDADEWIEWLRARPVVEFGQLGLQPFVMVHAAVHPDWGLEALRAHADSIHVQLASDDVAHARRFLAQDFTASPARDALGRLTSCRSVTCRGGWRSQQPSGEHTAWHDAWAARQHSYGVVYGHWSLQGLHVAKGLRGLDTGCVHHGRGRDGALTAWLPSDSAATPFDVPDDAFWQVPAHRMYYAH
jgi:bis(5'-nucleosyl)-tetraphosphatase (symmetrical)